MPVTVTTKELVDAATSGALARYFALEKPVTVAWKNRKQVETCEREFKRCNELRIEICKKHGRLDEKTNTYLFVGEGLAEDAQAAFDAELALLWKQTVDIPGEPVSVSSLKGPLGERDAALLEPFLTD